MITHTLLSVLMGKRFALKLATDWSESHSKSQVMVGALLYGQMTQEAIQSIAELSVMTQGRWPEVCIVPLRIGEVINCGTVISLEEDEEIPF